MNKLQWLGTVSSVIGSFIVALGITLPGYIAFLCGSISWLIVGVIGKSKPLIILNASFLTANLIGLYNAIL